MSTHLSRTVILSPKRTKADTLVDFFRDLNPEGNFDKEFTKTRLREIAFTPLSERHYGAILFELARILNTNLEKSHFIRSIITTEGLLDKLRPEKRDLTNPDSLIGALKFWSHFNKAITPQTYHSIYVSLEPFLPKLKPDAYALVTASIKKFGLRPSSSFLDSMEAASMSKLSRMSGKALANYLTDIAHLGFELKKPSFDYINKAVLALPEEGLFESRKKLIWTLAAIDSQQQDKPLWPAASSLFTTPHGPGDSATTAAAFWFQIHYVPRALDSGNTESRSEVHIKNIFKNVGCTFIGGDAPISLGLQNTVDMHVLYKGIETIIEYDGPKHFIKDVEENEYYSGPSQFNARLMAQYCADRVLRMDYKSAKYLEVAPVFLAELFATALLDKATALPRGAYKGIIADNKVSILDMAP